MINENTKRPRVYFSETQRKWSTLQAEAALEMIDGLARHNDETDMFGETASAAQKAA
ncbi:hypothetical protein [Nisaea nitritireducens]|uniref:hypothetical protein n=1 Tax=Nisaea nitritireducens TaxID=568392 RepID=UPI001867939A|nr:hypothetical protein [Nisaea nitritireducens]